MDVIDGFFVVLDKNIILSNLKEYSK